MEVKKALEKASKQQTANSKQIFEEAKKILKAKGLERAEKKAERETGVYRVFSYVHFTGTVGAMVKLACETDFVAKTDEMAQLGKELAMQIASMEPRDVDELMKQAYLRDGSKTIEELVKEVSGKTGENVRVSEIVRVG